MSGLREIGIPRLPQPDPGLCGTCRNARIVETRGGARFYLCRLSTRDPRFPRYPRLPVLVCAGYVGMVDGG